jgi:preprotein translocase subunit YajC
MNLTFLADATASPAPTSSGGGNTLLLVGYIVFFGALMYFLIFLPQKRREKKAKAMMESLTVGAEITTIGGVVGTIINIQDDDVTIETGILKTQLKFKKWAIRDVAGSGK